MTTNDYIDWVGQSGQTYRYWFSATTPDVGWQEKPGNYAFVKKRPNGNYIPLYFGETEKFSVRMPNHEVWAKARQLGATHIMSHITQDGERARLSEERDLIRYWNPPLNIQHRTTG